MTNRMMKSFKNRITLEEIEDIVRNNEPHLALYAPNEGLYCYEEILFEWSVVCTSVCIVCRRIEVANSFRL